MSADIILAIDTSFDETSVAVVNGFAVLSNVIASQAQLHVPYGGVFPTLAKQAHKENIDPAIALALKRAHVQPANLSAIAVTQGPGLAPALEIGIAKAKSLATTWHKPLIPVNHIEGHVLSVLARPKSADTAQHQPKFPALSLVISGGHSEFILVHDYGRYVRLGWTIDDAAGECLDKIGRMLNLGYPAGPVIEQFAKLTEKNEIRDQQFDFPLPMTTSGDYNLSFSGLKTFARNLITKLEAENKLSGKAGQQLTYNLCAAVQTAVFRHIAHKLRKILLDHPETNEVWLGGGVAANMTLRKVIRTTLKSVANELNNKDAALKRKPQLFRAPYSKKLCGDNGAMIGVVGGVYLGQKKPILSPNKIERKPNWPLTIESD